MKPIKEGLICAFTIKNASYPDYICTTASSAMCCDIHPKFPYMVVVGLHDGNMWIFNIQASCKEPAFKSNSVTQKHGGMVWEVNP